MNRLIRLSTILAIAFSALSAFAQHALAAENSEVVSLCSVDENVVFTCMTRQQKNASLCASKNLLATEGYLIYRFGRIGKKPELVYPNNDVKPSKVFTYDFYYYIKGQGAQVAFSINADTYTLYDDLHSFGDSGPGIIVQKSGKQITRSECMNSTGVDLYLINDIELKEAEAPIWPERTGKASNTPQPITE